MTILAVIWTFFSGLVINEFSDLAPWAAGKVVRWSARVRYPDQARAEARAEELAALIDARPGKLLKLITALFFAAAAIRTWTRRTMTGMAVTRIQITAGGALALNMVMTAGTALAVGLAAYDSIALSSTTQEQPSRPAVMSTDAWVAHYGLVNIRADGSFTLRERTYTWCDDGPPPCDSESSDGAITYGDQARGHLASSSGNVMTGVVITTTDPGQTPKGRVTFTFDPRTDILLLSTGEAFCGPRSAPGACGA